MSKLEAFILGIIQGLTEFLPISSTGHLYLGRHLFGLDEAGLFLDTMLHVGTLLAVLVVYKNELLQVLKNPLGKLSMLLVIGTIPAVIVGLLFSDLFDSISKTGVTIGWEFLVTGMILWFADRIRNGAKKMESISYGDALFIGTFQAAAIFPAVSRSGLTIAAGLFRKLDRETAAYFSFLLSIPAIAGGIVLQFGEMLSGRTEAISLGSLFVATLSSAIFGYMAVVWMINFLKRKSLKIFAVYVWVLGISIIILQMTGIF
ncbi:undecaprenyl-diphosphate phosphatase [Bacillus sp. DTU_2020_1000418_1_SI_GHA_SEK_038]|uniref:undecaprenyl-diphosphate phosphatase n=1 Tax=Bacillus sp. DTU_2020_1000418_1_SI_GHA_SEK_038 TaxID=3077585 RepID=UPI0028E33BA9|nr:undecaprenyl-diphosphate phosphatase [Bacillus sp. DTU_2020_1000418_1_SI_GHA_SEK_038]WNS73860.1 undecaprenyl-diphosphate phosphatase [Bacillus sp. DTU_2020_1000418_1_SI_GHA_SEK_038]